MLQKIIQNKAQFYEKIPSLILTVCIFYSLYGFFRIADFPVLRHAEWDMLKIFSSETSAFPVMKQGWPVIPELIAHLFYFCGGWNIRAYLVLNYLIYAADILLLYDLIVGAAGKYRYLPLFFIPFFSDLNVLNLMQVNALPIHLTLFFGLIAVKIGFQCMLTYRNCWLFMLFLILSALSMNAVFAGIVFLCWAIMQIIRGNVALIIGMFLVLIFFLTLLLFASNGYFLMGFDISWRKAAITFSAVLTGFDIASSGICIFLIPISAALIWGIYKNELWKDSQTVMLGTILCALFFSSAAVFSVPPQLPFSFINAGAGFIIFSVPVVFSLLRVVRPVFVGACCFAILGYSAAFSHQAFRNEALIRNTTRKCIQEYFAGDKNSEACQKIEDKNLPDVLEQVKKMNLSFIRPLI